MERFASRIAAALSPTLGLAEPLQAQDLEVPPDPKMGDFAFPCFKLAKQFRKAPPQVAQDLLKDLQSKGSLPPEITARATGPYVNFHIASAALLKALLGDILASAPNGTENDLGSYGSLPPKSRGSWVLEYSSPNVAKPLNIYHLRPTALGAALDRIGRFRGFDVISINHLGDWGKQYGMLTVAFRKYGKKLEDAISMQELVDLYVKINADAANDPSIEEEARQAFLKLEQGDPHVIALWKKCVDISVAEFQDAYRRLGVRFDHIWGESYYKDQLHPLIADMKKRGLLVESEGAWVVPVTDDAGRELPPCIVEKSDGATIYATRDLAAAIYREKRFHFERMTYIVGGEQRLHFQQLFAVLKKMGFAWASKCEHVPTGLYRFNNAKMSTRKGNFTTLDGVLAIAKQRVAELMIERAQTQAEGEKSGSIGYAPDDKTCEAIAIGATVFHDLHTDPAKDVDFDLDRVVAFEGETGPYLQYAHTRCQSILRKARETNQLPKGGIFQPELLAQLKAPEEIALVKTLGQLPLHLERTLKFAKASQLAHYLIDVTQAFGLFYRECRVLGEAPELTQARLMLVEATRRILARGLGLLGIPLPERM